jgi:hypothetical protein
MQSRLTRIFSTTRAVAGILVMSATGVSAPAQAQTQTGALWCYQYVLATWSPRNTMAPVLTGIAGDRKTPNASALDSVAQFLLDHLDDPQLAKGEALAVVSLLARTRSGRYTLVMTRVQHSQRPRVLTDMARQYVLENKKSRAEQYVPGTLDLASLRGGYAQAALAVKPTEERARRLDSLPKFSSFDELFTAMGPPQHVEARYFRFSETIQFSRLILYYRGAGRATFGLDDSGGWLLQGTVTDPLAFEDLMPYRERAGELGLPDDAAIRMAQLNSQSLPAMLIAIEQSYQLIQVPLEFLDTTAEILAQNWRTSGDERTEDVHAWMIRLLTLKGGPRYAPLLQQIGEKTDNLKLRKWAGLTIQKPAGIPRTPYLIGSVVLAEQARRFPSPYPDVTYTNGHL